MLVKSNQTGNIIEGKKSFMNPKRSLVDNNNKKRSYTQALDKNKHRSIESIGSINLASKEPPRFVGFYGYLVKLKKRIKKKKNVI